jgi:hypothetical protein
LHEAWSSVLGTADLALALDGATLAPALDRLVDQCRSLTSMRITLRIIGDLVDFAEQVKTQGMPRASRLITSARLKIGSVRLPVRCKIARSISLVPPSPGHDLAGSAEQRP